MGRPAIDYGRLFQDLPGPYMLLDRDYRFLAANDRYCEITSRSQEQLIGRAISAVFPEIAERVERLHRALDRAFAGETISLPRTAFRVGQPSDGARAERFWDICIFPVFDPRGEIVAVAQKASEVTDLVESERLRQTVLDELDHRVKNMLAKVTAIARRSAAGSENMSEFLARFSERLRALARTQQLLLTSNSDSLSLRRLIADELAPYGAIDGKRIAVDGPDLMVRDRIAQALGMAFHELATNAAKHGALGQESGALQVSWSRLDGGGVAIDWVETGTTVALDGLRAGFGSTVLDRLTPMEIGGSVDRRLGADGLRCRIEVPHPSRRQANRGDPTDAG